VDQWIDKVLGCGIWIAGGIRTEEGKSFVFSIGKGKENDASRNIEVELPNDNDTRKRDQDLRLVDNYLQNLHLPTSLSEKERTRLTRYSRHFFVCGDQLWRCDKTG